MTKSVIIMIRLKEVVKNDYLYNNKINKINNDLYCYHKCCHCRVCLVKMKHLTINVGIQKSHEHILYNVVVFASMS